MQRNVGVQDRKGREREVTAKEGFFFNSRDNGQSVKIVHIPFWSVASDIFAWRYFSSLAIISVPCSPVVVIFDLSGPLPCTSWFPYLPGAVLRP